MTKLYAIMGNCQANAVASTLQVCAEFAQTYTLVRLPPIHRIAASEHRAFVTTTLPQLDLFLYQPISEGFRGGGFGFAESLQGLKPGAQAISYPSIQFYGYHASGITLPDLPDRLRQLTHARFGVAGGELFHFAQLMTSFVRDETEAQAARAFHEGRPGDADFVRQRARHSLAYLARSEEKHDVMARLSPLIAAQYTQRQLFWSPRHPKGELLAAIALQVLDRLGIRPTAEEIERLPKRDPLKLPQYPLQSFAREALGLQFDGLTAFRSRTATLTLPAMVAAYYEIYRELGAGQLAALMAKPFAALPSAAPTLPAPLQGMNT